MLEKNITIPVSFYRYLTEVSRELVFGAYPEEIHLKCLPTREEKEKITLNDFTDFLQTNYLKDNTIVDNETYLPMTPGFYQDTKRIFQDSHKKSSLTIKLFFRSAMGYEPTFRYFYL